MLRLCLKKKNILVCVGLFMLLFVIFNIHQNSKKSMLYQNQNVLNNYIDLIEQSDEYSNIKSVFQIPVAGRPLLLDKLRNEQRLHEAGLKDVTVHFNVHAFYYAWYGNVTTDGKYYHWNHRILPHWKEEIAKKYTSGKRHNPPDDIASTFYPVLGPYSSSDVETIKRHMEYCVEAGIGVLALSYYPVGMADDEGKPMFGLIRTIMDVAQMYGIKVCFHIEPYENRTALSVATDIKFLCNEFQSHPAFYTTTIHRSSWHRKPLPLFYIYDSYRISSVDWKLVLGYDSLSNYNIRGQPHDAVVIGLYVERDHRKYIVESGFDGFYTYFASSGFTYGSTWRNWRTLSAFAKENELLFIPSVGPGYDDVCIRPWNSKHSRPRDNGLYYEKFWAHAVFAKPQIVSITSFNEWHEGSQIEPAMSRESNSVQRFKSKGFKYEVYDKGPNQYLKLTRKWVTEFQNRTSNSSAKYASPL